VESHDTAFDPHRRLAWLIAVTATLGMSVSYIDRQTLSAMAPAVTKALSMTNTQYGWLVSAFSIAYLAFTPLAGVLVDRLGARRGFAAAVLVWSIVAAAHALATSFVSLFVLRILLGTAEAPSFPAAAQTVRRTIPDARRSLAVGLLFTGSSLGAVVAAKLAIRLEAAYGFRGAFLGTALIGLVWLPLWWWVTHGDDIGSPSTPKGRGHESSEPWTAVIMSPPVLRSVIAVIGSAPANLFALNWTSKYLVDAWGMPKDEIGNYLIAPPLLFDVGAIGFGAIASAREARAITNSSVPRRTQSDLVVFSTLLMCALALSSLAKSPTGAITLVALAACGGGGLHALVIAEMLTRVPVGRASAAGGMTAAANSLAYVVAGPLIGWTVDSTHRYSLALISLGLVVIPTSLAFLRWRT
jgi:ACS family hexuronate transporter-like MFS transporter